MHNILHIQEVFNESFNFNKLKNNTKTYIQQTLQEADNEFFYDFSTNKNEIEELRKMRIDYELTQLYINRIGCMPSFSLKFYLYKNNETNPQYTYEVEYNLDGEFLDEYFLEY